MTDEKASDSLNDRVEKVLGRLVDQSGVSMKQSIANDFTTLVRLLRKMDEGDMKRFWNKYFDCIKSKVCSSTNMKDLYR